MLDDAMAFEKNLLLQLCVLSLGKHLNNKITQSYTTSEKVFQKNGAWLAAEQCLWFHNDVLPYGI